MSEPFTPEELESARVAFARPAVFIMGVAETEQLPPPDVPEVAFAGRSNVGKSSLINALTGQKHLARASTEPGRTREVNLFGLEGVGRLVDLPGYGFAVAGKKVTRRFQNLGRDYLRGRVNLRRVFLLIDARHGLKAADGDALAALDLAAVSYQIVLTKADKVRSAAAVEDLREATLKAVARRPASFPRVLATSSETGAGIDLLRAEVMDALAR